MLDKRRRPREHRRTTLNDEDLIRAIVVELRPMKYPESTVVAKVSDAIDEVRDNVRNKKWLSELGLRSENKRILKDWTSAIYKIKKQNTPELIRALSQSLEEDISGELAKLDQLLDKLAERGEKARLNPGGVIPNINVGKIRTAFTAWSIFDDVSDKRPAAGNRNTSFCIVASLLFEAATGRSSNLERACKTVQSWRSWYHCSDGRFRRFRLSKAR
jgi:hypothetical protein